MVFSGPKKHSYNIMISSINMLYVWYMIYIYIYIFCVWICLIALHSNTFVIFRSTHLSIAIQFIVFSNKIQQNISVLIKTHTRHRCRTYLQHHHTNAHLKPCVSLWEDVGNISRPRNCASHNGHRVRNLQKWCIWSQQTWQLLSNRNEISASSFSSSAER